MLEDIVEPDSIYIFLFLFQVECSKTFNCIIFETPTEFISIRHVECPKTFLVVHIELSFVVQPVDLAQIEAPVGSLLLGLTCTIVVKDTKSIKRVVPPAAWVANLPTGVVKNSISFKLAFWIEFSLISCSVLEVKMPVCSSAEFVRESLPHIQFLNDSFFLLNSVDRGWNSEGLGLSLSLIEDVNRSLKFSGANLFKIVEVLSLGSLFCLHNLHAFRSDRNHGLSYMHTFSYLCRNIIVSQRLPLLLYIFQWVIESWLILIDWWKWNVRGYIVIRVTMGRRRRVLLGWRWRRYICRSAYHWVCKSKSGVGMLRFCWCDDRSGLRFLTRWWRTDDWWGWRRDSILERGIGWWSQRGRSTWGYDLRLSISSR